MEPPRSPPCYSRPECQGWGRSIDILQLSPLLLLRKAIWLKPSPILWHSLPTVTAQYGTTLQASKVLRGGWGASEGNVESVLQLTCPRHSTLGVATHSSPLNSLNASLLLRIHSLGNSTRNNLICNCKSVAFAFCRKRGFFLLDCQLWFPLYFTQCPQNENGSLV